MPARQACGVCGHKEYGDTYTTLDYISGERFTIAECLACSVKRTILTENMKPLSFYYGETYYGNEAGTRFVGPVEAAISAFRRVRVKQIERLITRKTARTALDVGCGRGVFLQTLQQSGWHCFGVEASKELADNLKTTHKIETCRHENLVACNYPAEFFSLITFWHSLEHISSPRQTIHEAARILKAEGVMIIEVPNAGSWQYRVGKGRWFHLDAPRHLYHFTTQQITEYLIEEGLTIRSTSTFSLEYGPYGFAQTLLNLVTQKPNALYSILKSKREDVSSRDALLSLVFLPAAVMVGTIIELIATVFNRGGIVRIIAEKQAS